MTRESKIRRTDEIVSKMIALWPLWLTLAGGAVTAVNFYQKVNELLRKMDYFETQTDQRKEKNNAEKEEIRNRITKLEVDVSWIKHVVPPVR